MLSKRSQEAYILIDHRNSPGISPEFVRANGLDAPAVGAGQTFESAMVVCHCCQADVVLNPNRTRERAWCWKHDAYTCDNCAAAQKAGAECVPAEKRYEQIWDKINRGSK
jgi:hypothetical protein